MRLDMLDRLAVLTFLALPALALAQSTPFPNNPLEGRKSSQPANSSPRKAGAAIETPSAKPPGDPNTEKLWEFLHREYSSMLLKQRDRVGRSLILIGEARVPPSPGHQAPPRHPQARPPTPSSAWSPGRALLAPRQIPHRRRI